MSNKTIIRLASDYQQNAHPDVIKALGQMAGQDRPGYSEDDYTQKSYEIVRQLCQKSDADVFYIAGGTLANLTVIRSLLRPHQGVIAADTGHIAVHETGAIEATGHKVLTVPTSDGKLKATDILKIVEAHHGSDSYEHQVQPGMIYVSQPTELGTLYTKAELQEIKEYAKMHRLPIFLDGARLAYAMAADKELDFADYASLTDVFTIGLTKCGGLFGEVVCFGNNTLSQDFRYIMKQSGAMMAKGWLIAAQVDELLRNNAELYRFLGVHGVAMAQLFRNLCLSMTSFEAPPSPTNQLFIKTPRHIFDVLREQFAFDVLDITEAEAFYRICTSWSTQYEEVERLKELWEKSVTT